MLGVPARDPFVSIQTMESYGATIYHGLAAGIAVHFQPLIGQNYVDDAQNALVALFLESGCSDLVIMGDDQGWDAEQFIRLLSYDKPIVGAGVRMKSDEENYTVRLPAGEIPVEGGLVPILGEGIVGSGYLRMRRDFVEDMASKSDWYYLTRCKKDVPNLFERKRHGKGELGNPVQSSEDANLCWKAKAAGYTVYVDPEIDTTHVGYKTWTGRMGDFWRSVNGIGETQ